MRISNAFTHGFVANSTSRAKVQYYEAGRDTVQLRSVQRPSDDLPTAQKIHALDRALARLEAMGRSRQQLDADLNVVESTLQSAADVLTELGELAVQMANDTLNASDRQAGAAVAKVLRQTLLDLANTRQADGRYAFSGVAEFSPSLGEDGTYLGSEVQREVEVAPGMRIVATFSVADAFGTDAPLDQVDAFIAALESNDGVAVGAVVDELTALRESTTLGLASVGARIRSLTGASDTADFLDFHFTRERAELHDLDITAAITKFTATEQTLNAVINVSKRMLDMSIMPWLR